jgi:hypothetical protein
MLDDLWTNLLAASFWMPILGQVAGDASGRLAAAGLRAVAVGIVAAAPARRRPEKRGVRRLVHVLASFIFLDERLRPKRSRRQPAKGRVAKKRSNTKRFAQGK